MAAMRAIPAQSSSFLPRGQIPRADGEETDSDRGEREEDEGPRARRNDTAAPEEIEGEKALEEVGPGAERRKERRGTEGEKQRIEKDRVPVTKERPAGPGSPSAPSMSAAASGGLYPPRIRTPRRPGRRRSAKGRAPSDGRRTTLFDSY